MSKKKNETFTVTKEAVLKAAKVCSQAEKVLKTLFPVAFESEFHECKVGQRFKVTSDSHSYDAVLVQYGPGMCNLIDTRDWNRLFDRLNIETDKERSYIHRVPKEFQGFSSIYTIKKVD